MVDVLDELGADSNMNSDDEQDESSSVGERLARRVKGVELPDNDELSECKRRLKFWWRRRAGNFRSFFFRRQRQDARNVSLHPRLVSDGPDSRAVRQTRVQFRMNTVEDDPCVLIIRVVLNAAGRIFRDTLIPSRLLKNVGDRSSDGHCIRLAIVPSK